MASPTSGMEEIDLDIRCYISNMKYSENIQSLALSTERTILLQFAKEYRVLASICGILLFLEVYSFKGIIPKLKGVYSISTFNDFYRLFLSDRLSWILMDLYRVHKSMTDFYRLLF